MTSARTPEEFQKIATDIEESILRREFDNIKTLCIEAAHILGRGHYYGLIDSEMYDVLRDGLKDKIYYALTSEK